jgi:two-component system chemotaxis sensor kinase CheA
MSELSPDELRMLRSFFLDEATEHLEAVESALTTLEGSPDDAVALAAMLRRLHTLKGSAGSVELDDLSRDAHAAEDRVVALREAGRAPSDTEVAELVAAVGAVRARVAEVVRLVHGALPPPRSSTPPLPRKSPVPKREITQPRGEVMQIRVEVGQVDELMDAVARLLIDRTRLERRLSQLDGCVREVARVKAALRGAAGDAARLAEVDAELEEAVGDLERAGAGLSDDAELLGQTSRALQEGLQRVRMMEVGRLFARVATPLREMARRAGKQVELSTSGERTAIDKAVVERVVDPLLHLLRNAVAHGIERSEERVRAGKPEAGRVEIAARQRGDQIILEVADDGAGVDLERVRSALGRARHLKPAQARALGEAELTAAIFDPGISTRDEVDDLAGRGVGLDVVKEAIERLGGVIRCRSPPRSPRRSCSRSAATSTRCRRRRWWRPPR